MGEGLQVCKAIRRLLVLTLPGDDRVSFLPVSQVKIGFFRKTLNPNIVTTVLRSDLYTLCVRDLWGSL